MTALEVFSLLSPITLSSMYHTASETSLHGCYYSCMLRAMEGSASTLAIPCINQERKGFPRELAAHISLRTIRRFFEAHQTAPAVVLAIESAADVAVYDVLLPLYFPRSDDEACVAATRLPADLGNRATCVLFCSASRIRIRRHTSHVTHHTSLAGEPVTGAPHFPDRDVRVSALPGSGGSARAEAPKELLDDHGAAVNLNRSWYVGFAQITPPFVFLLMDVSPGHNNLHSICFHSCRSYQSDFDAPFTAMRSDMAVASRANDPTVAAALAESKYSDFHTVFCMLF